MNKFRLFFMATLVACVSLTSCGEEDEVTTVEIALESATVASGASVNGTITALGGLEQVTLLGANDATVTGWPVKSFSTAPILKSTEDGKYTILISGLADGVYTLRATDKKAVEKNVTFSVGTLKVIANATTIYCTVADGSSKSTCASADGTTYAPKDATAEEQAKVDFVYFNASGTSKGIYAPSAIPAVLNNAFATWTVKNETKFAKVANITFADATLAQVKTAADAAIETSVTGLAANEVVVFKTASGKVGVFKVNSITPGFLAIDNVNINIKVKE